MSSGRRRKGWERLWRMACRQEPARGRSTSVHCGSPWPRGHVPGAHTPFPAQQIKTEAQGSAEGRFAEPGLYRYLSIVDLPCFSWLTRMFWRWCTCNTTSRLLCRAEWQSMRFFCSFQSPGTLRDLRAESGVLRPSAGHARGRLGLGMGLAATLCGKGGLCGWPS